MFLDYFNSVIESISIPEYIIEVDEAKREYFEIAGHVVEDDISFESRMKAFIEWYLMDRSLKAYGITPLEKFMQDNNNRLPRLDKELISGLTNNVHTIVELRKIKKYEIIAKDFISSKTYTIYEDRGTTGFQKGHVFEARIFPFLGTSHFTGAFIFHPQEAKRFITKQIKTLKKQNPSQPDLGSFIFTLSKMSLKLEKFKHLKPGMIYC